MPAEQPLGPRRQSSTRRLRIRNLLVGALLGAAGMLLALPASRPFYVGALMQSRLDRALAKTRDETHGATLPTARSLDGQAMWFALAAGRIRSNRVVSTREAETVEGLMAAAGRAEPENAFWLQADAALLSRLGRLGEAERAWLAASHRLKWDDHQTEFLERALAGQSSVPAYAYAELCELRTDNTPWFISEGGKTLLGAAWNNPNLNLPLRLATVLDGNLVRQHAHSVDAMRRGAEIIESAVTRPTDDREPSQPRVKVQIIAREKFWDAIAKAQLGFDYKQIEHFFLEADAANALTTIEDVPGTMRMEAEESAILHSAPGGFLFCTLLGGGVLALRWVLWRLARAGPRLSWLRTSCTAVAAVTAGLFVTSAYAAFALGLCILFAESTPAHVRKRRPTWLGPLFAFTTSCVATTLLAAGSVGLMLNATPSRVLLVPKLPAAFDGQAAVCGVVALAIGFLYLCAPLWAYAQRLPTTYVLDLGLRQVGQKLVLGSLMLAIASGPTCVYLDKLLVQHRLRDQFLSEPNFFLFPHIKPSDSATP